MRTPCYSPLGKAFKRQTKTIENLKVNAIEEHRKRHFEPLQALEIKWWVPRNKIFNKLVNEQKK